MPSKPASGCSGLAAALDPILYAPSDCRTQSSPFAVIPSKIQSKSSPGNCRMADRPALRNQRVAARVEAVLVMLAQCCSGSMAR